MGMKVRSFDSADETRTPAKTTVDVVDLGSAKAARITLEPGCYRQGYGGCRLEDLVVVTADGYETLTDFPYDL